MKKITTFFLKNPADLSKVIDEVDPQNSWVEKESRASRKWDGTACAIIEGRLYKRYDAKHGKPAPENGIACQEPDKITGHWPHWVPCDRKANSDKYLWEAFDAIGKLQQVDGTYEAVGPKINDNRDNLPHHVLVRHGGLQIRINDYSFSGLKKLLEEIPFEGIVFTHADGRMCKIRKEDFGIKWK